MMVVDIRALAKMVMADHGKLEKTEMIRSIQMAEGQSGCFATPVDGVCDRIDCVWRDDCFETAVHGEKRL